MSGGRAKKVVPVAKAPPANAHGVAVKKFPDNAKALFMRKPKSPEPDSVGRKVRPSARAKRLTGRAL